MKNDYKTIINEMLGQLDPTEDYRFLKQLYTLLRKHLTKKGRH